MKPPRCYVCHRTIRDIVVDIDDHFTLIYFGETEADKLAPSRAMGAFGIVGHASNAVWFCNDHASLAREHQNMPVEDALKAIGRLANRPPRHWGDLQGMPISRCKLRNHRS